MTASKQMGKARGIYLSDDLWEWVKEKAQADRRPVSNYIAIVLEDIKNKAPKKSK